MRYLLDTNIFIAWMSDGKPEVTARFAKHVGEYGISSVVLFELYFGAFNSGRVQENLNLLAGLQFPVLDFDEADARAAGQIRAHLKKIGKPIGSYDALIAGQALARGLIMVTNNISEFSRVPGLMVEDWTG